MNRMKFALIALATVFVWASVAQAGEEGVITKKSKLTLTGRIHAQFQTTSVEDYSPSSTFSIRRARIKAGFVHGALKGLVQYDFGEGDAGAKDVYVDWKLSDGFKIKMGQYKMPFSLWELTSSTKIALIERANKIMGSANDGTTNNILVKDGGWAGRDIGVQVHGSGGKVSYALGLFNGNGLNNKRDDDSGKTFAGRVVIEAADKFDLGASFSNRMYNDYVQYTNVAQTDSTISDESFYAVEVDADYGIGANVDEKGPWVQAEFSYGKNPHFDTDTKFMGFMAVFTYNVLTPNSNQLLSMRPAFRFDYGKRNTDDDDSATILITPGIDFFLSKSNRIAVNFDVNMPQADGADTEYGFRTQFQMLI